MTGSNAMPSKPSFGAFVQTKRRESDMTQRHLASELFVTESAVSKWERGLSYPDISVVGSLARVLGVSESELINASEDREARLVTTQARQYRRWRAAVIWATNGALGAALITSFVVNLAVQHTLSWFWVVAAALAVGASLITVPLITRKERGWATLGAFLVSLIVLLRVVRLLYGGDFFLVTVASILFAAAVVFLPFAVRRVPVGDGLARHKTVLVLGVNSALLFAYLFILLSLNGALEAFFSVAVPVAAIGLLPAWVIGLTIRYLPVSAGYRAAVIMGVLALYLWMAGPLVNGPLAGRPVDVNRVDFSDWSGPSVEGNVATIVAIACLAVGVLLCAIERVRTVSRSRGL